MTVLKNKKSETINPATEESVAAPDIWDTKTSATVIYQGWKTKTGYRIRKTDTEAETNTYAYGDWEKRTTLNYS